LVVAADVAKAFVAVAVPAVCGEPVAKGGAVRPG
jgi:hypothetical protein